MAFDLHIATDNAAFADRQLTSNEISNLLAKVDYRIAGGFDQGRCVDSNGNTVGYWSLKEGGSSPKKLAEDVLTMAAMGHMPATYWATDQRIIRACEVLGLEPDGVEDYAYDLAQEYD